jgi:hypothetical protein
MHIAFLKQTMSLFLKLWYRKRLQVLTKERTFSRRKNAAYPTRYVLAYIYLNSISYFIFGNYLAVVAAVAVYEIGNFYRVLLAPTIIQKNMYTHKHA